ncbi:MAG: hypothetical protein JWN11_912 [Hyphomicrobiales bacterium]|nr:hypothetical protein [Hyphomicrobiales bacterium]
MQRIVRSRFAPLGLFCGIAAPLLYCTIVIWAARMNPGYSHFSDAIISLGGSDRVGTDAVQSLFGLYNLLEIAFAIAGLATFRRPRLWKWVFASLLVTGIAGVLAGGFAMDPIGRSTTPAGIVNLILAAIASLGTMTAILLSVLAWGTTPLGRAPGMFSAACLAIVFIFFLVAAMMTASGWPLPGVLERITIGTFMVWQLAMAMIFLLRYQYNPHFLETSR